MLTKKTIQTDIEMKVLFLLKSIKNGGEVSGGSLPLPRYSLLINSYGHC